MDSTPNQIGSKTNPIMIGKVMGVMITRIAISSMRAPSTK